MNLPEAGSGTAQRSAYAIQIHPSLRCNLSCAHCYSRSGPTVRTGLNAGTVRNVISDAAALGYEVVAFSGGEPFMYDGLAAACAFAKSLGLTVAVTTNGFFLDARHLEPLAESVTGIAISLDGEAATHNALRGNRAAYDRMARGLDAVRACGVPFGFIHTLTAQSWPQLESLVAFAADAGATLFQIHPLEVFGRAEDWDVAPCAGDTMLAKVYVLARLLNAQYGGRPYVTVDLAPTSLLVGRPELIYAEEDAANDAAVRDSTPARVRNLIVEADGTVVPFTFGIAREYAIGNVAQERLCSSLPRYLADGGYDRLRRLCRRVHAVLAGAGAPPLTNWYDVLRRESQASMAVS